MITSFNCAETAKVFNAENSRKLPPAILRRAFVKLQMIDVAQNINDLRNPPANQLKALSGNRRGQYSIRINDQYRICFEWRDNHAHNVEIVDYH